MQTSPEKTGFHSGPKDASSAYLFFIRVRVGVRVRIRVRIRVRVKGVSRGGVWLGGGGGRVGGVDGR